MARADRPTTDHLKIIDAAGRDAGRWGFLALLRRAEAHAPTLPRIGRSRLPAQNVVDLAQTPSLAFPSSTVESVERTRSGRRRVRSLFLGLTGPMGALPIHLTEYAFYERRMGEQRPFGRWLDVLTDRMLQFFYRAWADTQPAAQADRKGDDRFGAYVAALSGAGGPLAEDREGGFDHERRLHYAGAFVSRRSAAVMRDGLSHILRRPVRLKEFIPRWRDIDPADRTRLGAPDRGGRYNQLGLDMVLGARVRQAEDTFRVMVRAVSTEDYARLLPGQSAHDATREALHALTPSELSWELQLEIDEAQAPGARLDGASPLGLMSWAAPKGRAGLVRADARMRN